MPAIKDHIIEDMKTAMRAQEKERLATIRLILAALKQKEVDERITLTDEQVLSILRKMIKQRKDSITQFEAGNRQDLAQKEATEIKVIENYLPTQLDEQEVGKIIQDALAQTSASSMKDMGKVMAILKPALDGKTDLAAVSAKVKAKLSG